MAVFMKDPRHAFAKFFSQVPGKSSPSATDHTLKIPDPVIELVFQNLTAQECHREPSRVC